MKKQALLILGLMVLGVSVPTAALADWTEDQKEIWTTPATPGGTSEEREQFGEVYPPGESGSSAPLTPYQQGELDRKYEAAEESQNCFDQFTPEELESMDSFSAQVLCDQMENYGESPYPWDYPSGP